MENNEFFHFFVRLIGTLARLGVLNDWGFLRDKVLGEIKCKIADVHMPRKGRGGVFLGCYGRIGKDQGFLRFAACQKGLVCTDLEGECVYILRVHLVAASQLHGATQIA